MRPVVSRALCRGNDTPMPFRPCQRVSLRRWRHDSSNSLHHGIPRANSDGRWHLGPSHAPLALLPLRNILRSLATSTISSSSLLLPLSLSALAIIANSKTPLLDPDHNPLLRYILDKSLYKQFCAGKTIDEVSRTVAQVKHIGFSGAILACAKETPNDGSQAPHDELASWTDSSLQTVRMAESGDFIALKFSGAGTKARGLLARKQPPHQPLDQAIAEICKLAASRGVSVVIDGEQEELQPGIDDWTIRCADKYNTASVGRPVVFGTYQAYKRTTPSVLSRHLAHAQRVGITLGVKLVRGAYLATDPRDIFQDTKADTDAFYDDIAAGVLQREWNTTVRGSGEFPRAAIMLATHNATSVRKAYAICCAGRDISPVSFGQLQGMADEISCELVEINKSVRSSNHVAEVLPVYKYMAWGSTGECVKYLLRRAQENRDAVTRTCEDRDAMRAELARRIKARFAE